jgi:hypothetical protein
MTKLPAAERPLSDAQREVLRNAPLDEIAKAKAWLLARGQVVSPRSVAAAVLASRERQCNAPAKAAEAQAHKAERRTFKADIAKRADLYGSAAAGLVAAWIAREGRAPTWSELCSEMGWHRWWQRNLAVPKLAKAGWLVTGAKSRSLRPGPKWDKP